MSRDEGAAGRWQALLQERLAHRIDDDTLRAELAAAGFSDPRAAAEATDQILALAPPDLSPADLLAGKTPKMCLCYNDSGGKCITLPNTY